LASQGKNAGTGTTQGSVSANLWDDPFNGEGFSDGAYVNCLINFNDPDGSLTNDLLFNNFGFTLEYSALIVGITVTFVRYCDNGIIWDYSVRLLVNGVLAGNDKSANHAWDTVDETFTFGTVTDTWGLQLFGSDLNKSNFGVQLVAQNFANDSSADTAHVDSCRVVATYILPDGTQGIIIREMEL